MNPHAKLEFVFISIWSSKFKKE